MRAAADTNVLLRAVVGDDLRQAATAASLLREAEVVAVSLSCLCEFVWVLARVYRMKSNEIGASIRALIASSNVVVDLPAVEMGLAVLDAGGDFADGVIAYEGRWLGGEIFVSFDERAVSRVGRLGHAAELLA